MVDVTIRGAGIFGLSIAWACHRAGAAVRVIDPAGVGAGASGGVVGALAPHVPENWNAKKAFQLDCLLAAGDFWRGVETQGKLPAGYARTGRLQPLADDRAVDLARRRAESARKLWRGKAEWQVIPATDAPWTLHSATGWLVFDTLSARLHPGQACAALAAALRAGGVDIVTDGPQRGAVVHASGWRGLQELNAAFGQPIGTGVKGQAAVLGLAAPDAPQLFVDGLHIVPHADGTTAIGSTTERDFDAGDTTDAQLDRLIEQARAALPALRDAPVLRRWAGVRPRARSRAPLLGPWPGRPGHFIANGGFKIGFGIAPGVADLMADLVLNGVNRIPPDFSTLT